MNHDNPADSKSSSKPKTSSVNASRITITHPDDWHLHLRDGAVLRDTVAFTAKQFARAIVMPNLAPPITTTDQAIAYRQRILAVSPKQYNFQPLMTLYLTDNTPVEEIKRAKQSGIIHGIKYYPAGATTNSDSGVTNIQLCYDTLEAMQLHDIPLLMHGEVVDDNIDIFDREKYFIERILIAIADKFPQLRIVFEHITTKEAVDFVTESRENIAATLTPQHLLYNRNALFKGGIRPHYYCLPVLKRESHRRALIAAATSGNKKFFLGTDSAPHEQHKKESSCGCAGIFSAPLALELYTRIFEENNALDKLEAFASFYGADFYGLPRNQEKITLIKNNWTVPNDFALGDDRIIPLHAGEQETWMLIAS